MVTMLHHPSGNLTPSILPVCVACVPLGETLSAPGKVDVWRRTSTAVAQTRHDVNRRLANAVAHTTWNTMWGNHGVAQTQDCLRWGTTTYCVDIRACLRQQKSCNVMLKWWWTWRMRPGHAHGHTLVAHSLLLCHALTVRSVHLAVHLPLAVTG